MDNSTASVDYTALLIPELTKFFECCCGVASDSEWFVGLKEKDINDIGKAAMKISKILSKKR